MRRRGVNIYQNKRHKVETQSNYLSKLFIWHLQPLLQSFLNLCQGLSFMYDKDERFPEIPHLLLKTQNLR